MGEAMTMSGRFTCFTRRQLLRTGAATGLVGLAGCGMETDRNGGATPESPSVFQSVSVEGKDLVVALREDNEVSEITLVKPDGSLYGQREVASGVTTIRFQLIDIENGQAEHYSPGKYELVANNNNQSTSETVEMRPELRIRDIRQYRIEDQPESYGHISIEIANVGTAPTWIYDIAYEKPPRRGATTSLGDRKNILHFKLPEENEEAILHPSETQSYVEKSPSLRFNERGDQSCGDTIETTLIVGTAVGDPLKQRIRIRLDGRSISVSAIGDFVCSNVTVEQLGRNDSATSVNNHS